MEASVRFLVGVGVAIAGGAALPYLGGWARQRASAWFASTTSAPRDRRAFERAGARLVLLLFVADIVAFAISFSPLAVGVAGLPREQRLWALGVFAASVCLSVLARKVLKK
jgi:hypothetical protein